MLTQVFEDLGGAPFELRLRGNRRHASGSSDRSDTARCDRRARQAVPRRPISTSPALISVSSIAGCVVVCARGQHLALEHRRRNGGALQLFDRIEHALPGPRLPDPTPCHDTSEAPERFRVDRLDFLSQPRERSPAKAAQHVGSIHSRSVPPGLNSPSINFPAEVSCRTRAVGDADAQTVAGSELTRGERPMRPRIPERQVAGRIAHGLEQRLGQPGGSGAPSASRYRATSSTAT